MNRSESDEKDQIIAERDESIRWLQGELAESRRTRDRVQAQNESLASQLQEIFNSRSWRWLMRYRRLRERLGLSRRRPIVATSGMPPPASPAVNAAAPPDPAVARPQDPYEALTLLPELSRDEAATLLAHGAGDRVRHRLDVICFSIVDWEFRFQRPQQVMSQFAGHGHRVFYISVSRFRAPGTPPDTAVRQVRDNVYEVQLAARRTFDVYGEVVSGEDAAALVDAIGELRRRYDIASAIAYVMIASWTEVALGAARRWDWPVIYDCMDEWDTFPGIKPALIDAEAGLVRRCDLLVVSAGRLEEKWRAAERPTVLARNGVDYEFYDLHCRPNSLLTGAPRPIVGYFGAIAEWFDIDLLARVARARPRYHFVLLGGVFNVDVSALDALPNVTLAGQQPYSTMPQYLFHFDACIIPFKVNRITEATDPVKLYEYLSAGKPVVSVNLPELAFCRDLVYLAADADDFAAKLDAAVVEDDGELVRRRRALAAQHTWRDRYERITAALAAVTEPVSIVIVTFGNLTLTSLCLESVLRNTSHANYEIVVVDNASADGTPAYLRYMAARHPEIRVVLNPVNAGFARANNQGIALSRGRRLVLLNNDTVVPPGWLSRLLRHLSDPEIGMVGPVTNFVGNEAKIEVAYRTWAEMADLAAQRARQHDLRRADISMLAMFCVALRRDAYDRVGPLDDQFGIGMFEDDDYAHRMRAAGFRVVCAADVFVHHVGQAAFKRLIEQGEYDALFDRNRRLYEAKWNVKWSRHRHAPLTFAEAPAAERSRV